MDCTRCKSGGAITSTAGGDDELDSIMHSGADIHENCGDNCVSVNAMIRKSITIIPCIVPIYILVGILI
jgi:hypothetical protein